MQQSPKEIARFRLGSVESRVRLYPSIDVALSRRVDAETHRSTDPAFHVVVTDTNTDRLIPSDVVVPRIVVPAGERCKEWRVLHDVLRTMADAELSRDAVVAAVGGGAVTDLTALAAGLYLRGVSTVLIPTSLLAMVDAAVGGKTGIDFAGYKNILGTFSPAVEVRIVPSVLASLSNREFKSGLAEVLKAAMLDDPELLTILEQSAEAVLARDPETLAEVISRAIAVKVRVVQDDFTEQGRRAILNLGHTFGHALESCSGLGTITHGEAVAWGIARASVASAHLRIGDPAWIARSTALLARYGYDTGPVPAGIDVERMIAAIAHDKKRRRDGVRFVLQRGPQETDLFLLDMDTVRHILQRG